MSDQIREQVSAFLDGELPDSETELLLKRLTRDAELRDSFGRYALIGESLRGAGQARLSRGFHARVNRAIDGDPAPAEAAVSRAVGARWWRPFAGFAVAAGVTTVAVLALQQRVDGPDAPRGMGAPVVQNVSLDREASAASKTAEALSYTVPASLPDAPSVMPAARLTNYVFAHSKYSSVMGQNDVLNDLLSTDNADEAAGNGASRDPRVAP